MGQHITIFSEYILNGNRTEGLRDEGKKKKNKKLQPNIDTDKVAEFNCGGSRL
jgi:hypothetical protein